jgi:AcrR family transcriptional regulator
VSNPLIDTLFRPTTGPVTGAAAPSLSAAKTASMPAIASAAPVRARGVHSRAGNAMNRTRAALLDGAARVVEVNGAKIAMAQVAAAAGVAKATLYNHFRTREAVLSALVLDQVRRIIDEQHGKTLDAALTDAALAISANRVRRGLARVDPASLVAIARIDAHAEAWQLARAAVAGTLAGASRGGTDTVLRWLASYLLTPGGPTTIAADVGVLLTGLPVDRATDRATNRATAVDLVTPHSA